LKYRYYRIALKKPIPILTTTLSVGAQVATNTTLSAAVAISTSASSIQDESLASRSDKSAQGAATT
jgi:hypothetical protein